MVPTFRLSAIGRPSPMSLKIGDHHHVMVPSSIGFCMAMVGGKILKKYFLSSPHQELSKKPCAQEIRPYFDILGQSSILAVYRTVRHLCVPKIRSKTLKSQRPLFAVIQLKSINTKQNSPVALNLRGSKFEPLVRISEFGQNSNNPRRVRSPFDWR